MKYFFNRINVFSKSSFSVQKYSRAGIHAEKRAKFPFNFGTFVHVAKAISPPQRLSPLNINVLYLYGTNMDAYDDR